MAYFLCVIKLSIQILIYRKMKQATIKITDILDNGNILYGSGAGLFFGFVSTYLFNSPVYLLLGISSGLIAGLTNECVSGYKKITKEMITFLEENRHLIHQKLNQINS
jgi:hypothetical protein